MPVQYPLGLYLDDWESVSGLFPETKERAMTDEKDYTTVNIPVTQKMKLVDGNLVPIEPTLEERVAKLEESSAADLEALTEIGHEDNETEQRIEAIENAVRGLSDRVPSATTHDLVSTQAFVGLEQRIEQLEMLGQYGTLVQHEAQIAELYDLLDEASKVIDLQASALVRAGVFGHVPRQSSDGVEKAMEKFHAKLAEAKNPISVPQDTPVERMVFHTRTEGKVLPTIGQLDAILKKEGYPFVCDGKLHISPNQTVTGKLLNELLEIEKGVQLYQRCGRDDMLVLPGSVIQIDPCAETPEFYTVKPGG